MGSQGPAPGEMGPPGAGLDARPFSLRHGGSRRGFGRQLAPSAWHAETDLAMAPPGARGPENPASLEFRTPTLDPGNEEIAGACTLRDLCSAGLRKARTPRQNAAKTRHLIFDLPASRCRPRLRDLPEEDAVQHHSVERRRRPGLLWVRIGGPRSFVDPRTGGCSRSPNGCRAINLGPAAAPQRLDSDENLRSRGSRAALGLRTLSFQ